MVEGETEGDGHWDFEEEGAFAGEGKFREGKARERFEKHRRKICEVRL